MNYMPVRDTLLEVIEWAAEPELLISLPEAEEKVSDPKEENKDGPTPKDVLIQKLLSMISEEIISSDTAISFPTAFFLTKQPYEQMLIMMNN